MSVGWSDTATGIMDVSPGERFGRGRLPGPGNVYANPGIYMTAAPPFWIAGAFMTYGFASAW